MAWCVAQIEINRANVAQHCLELADYVVYAPKIATARQTTTLLFPGYLFVQIVNGWWRARWSVGVVRLLHDGGSEPAHVADRIIAELRGRERNGLVQLPRKPPFQRRDAVKILAGPFAGQFGLFDGMKPHDRVLVLLRLLGGLQRAEFAKADIKRA